MNNSSNIEDQDDDLKGMAPYLSRLSDNNPFKAGADYFESFENKLQEHINELEEIKNEAPVLSNIPKYNLFGVPVDYFDELPTIIQQRCIDDKSRPSLLEWLLLLIKPRFAVPVLTTLFIAFTGINYMNKNIESSSNTVAEEISVEEQLQNIDESTLVEELASNPNESIEATANTTNEHILNYLIDNNIDENNLN